MDDKQTNPLGIQGTLAELGVEIVLTLRVVRGYLEWQYKKQGGPEIEASKVETPKVEALKPSRKTATARPPAPVSRSVTDALAELPPVEIKVPDVDPKEALERVYKLAADYITKEGPEQQEARKAELRRHIKTQYGKPNIQSLTTDQHVELADYIKDLNAEALGV